MSRKREAQSLAEGSSWKRGTTHQLAWERTGRGLASCAVAVALSLSFANDAKSAGFFGTGIEKDPVPPFTLYGDASKKFFIENLDETGKIVSRRKGFTTTVCITAADVSPQVAGPEALEEFGETTCVEVVGQDFERTCDKACSRGCEEQIRKYLNRIEQETGFKLEPGEPRRILVACSKRCFRESQRPGASRPFSLTWLR